MLSWVSAVSKLLLLVDAQSLCGDPEDEEMHMRAIELFACTMVIVVNSDSMYSSLRRQLPDSLTVLLVSGRGSTHHRTTRDERAMHRAASIRWQCMQLAADGMRIRCTDQHLRLPGVAAAVDDVLPLRPGSVLALLWPRLSCGCANGSDDNNNIQPVQAFLYVLKCLGPASRISSSSTRILNDKGIQDCAPISNPPSQCL